MAELFRYIERTFVAPSDKQAIDVGRQSDLQNSLRDAISERLPRDRLRSMADAFIAQHFRSPLDEPLRMGQQLRSFRERLAHPLHGTDAIDQLIAATFDSDATDLVGSDAFLADKALLDDILVSVKISTGFDRVNAHDLVAMRQVIAFIEDFASGKAAHATTETIREVLRRPIRIPSEFVYQVAASAEGQPSPPSEPPDESVARQRAALLAEQQHFKRAYEMIMSLPPDQFEMKPVSSKADGKVARNSSQSTSAKETPGRGGCAYEMAAASAAPSFLAISDAAIERLGGDVQKTLERANIDIGGSRVSHVISEIKRQWQDVSRQLAPYQAPAPTKVFRLGAHLFAVQDSTATIATGTGEVQ
jgi:hypothetical protein